MKERVFMIDKIKEDMGNHLGEEIKIIFNGGRNRKEEYNAILKGLYKFIFIVKLNNDINEIKSFTYSDVLTQTIEIFYK
jgi:uncharacterized protein Veg